MIIVVWKTTAGFSTKLNVGLAPDLVEAHKVRGGSTNEAVLHEDLNLTSTDPFDIALKALITTSLANKSSDAGFGQSVEKILNQVFALGLKAGHGEVS